jgi:hypothetical protein
MPNTSSEETCFKKNKEARKLLSDRLSHINREHKYNNFVIKEATKDAESYYRTVRLSTGSAFNQPEFNSQDFEEISKLFGKK